MSNHPGKPIVFLAFANEHEERIPHGYLRNLPQEVRKLRQAMGQAAEKDLCELEVLPNATLSEIRDVFRKHNDRIAIFHFGGHANSYGLLFEDEAGQTAAINAEGFAQFLAQQAGLQLVFLNACSTGAQVEALHQAGVPVVIATTTDIPDKMATAFAGEFYQSLATGVNSINKAFAEAVALVKAAGGNTRQMRPDESASEAPNEPFWHLYPADCYEEHIEWSLELAAGDPLFGLPPLPKQDLPQTLYRHLERFRCEDAEIFFGRSHEIAQLYRTVTDSEGAPIILLYGQSGVGKSSVLEAGLLPRLAQKHSVAYERRDRSKGLTATLTNVLRADDKATLLEAWHKIELDTKHPFTVVLDQVEEFFTQPIPDISDEMGDFMQALKAIFANRERRPCGRLLLSFRKEWLAEVEKRLTDQGLPHSKVFLKRLSPHGILDVITGPTRTPRLRNHYQLTVADDLPGLIAGHILTDQGSPVAPMLQILLAEMWTAAKAINYDHPCFDQLLYHQLRAKGLGLDDFLKRQLEALQKKLPKPVESGLALDLLSYHTTALGTAKQHKLTTIEETYCHQKDVAQELLQACRDLYLLVDPAANQPHLPQSSRLTHDTLAPHVRKRFDESDKLGQRARRILENRAVDWKENKEGPPLDGTDLSLVEAGQMGMRAWNPDESRLVEASRAAKAQREADEQREQQIREEAERQAQAEREGRIAESARADQEAKNAGKLRRRAIFLTAMAGLTAVLALIVYAFYTQANTRGKIDNAIATADRQANQALQQLTTDPFIALHSSRSALPNASDPKPYLPKAEFAFHQARHAYLEQNYLRIGTGSLTADRFAFGETRVAVVSDTQIIWVDYNLDRARVMTVTGHLSPVVALDWQADGQTLLSYDLQSVRVWRDGMKLDQHLAPGKTITCAEWHPQNKQVALCEDKALVIWTPTQSLTTTLHTFTNTLSGAVWSPSGKRLAAYDTRQSLLISTVGVSLTQRLIPQAHTGRIRSVAWANDSQHLVTASSDGFIHIWDPIDPSQDRVITHPGTLIGAQFINSTHFVTWGGPTDTARLWKVDGELARWFGSESDGVQDVLFTEQGLLTFFIDGDVQLWDVETGRRLAVFRGHTQRVLRAAWHGDKLATVSVDGTAHIWHMNVNRQLFTREFVVDENPIILRGHTSVGSSPRKDVLGVKWLNDRFVLTVGLDHTLRIWEVYDAKGEPLCSGVDGDGYPRCFKQSEPLWAGNASTVDAHWVTSNTLVATDRTNIYWLAAGDTYSYTLPLTPAAPTYTVALSWSPDGRQVLTYTKARGITDRFTGIIYNFADKSQHPAFTEAVDNAFWSDAGLLLSRPMTEPLLLDPLTGSKTMLPWPTCPTGKSCSITAVASEKSRQLLAAGDQLGRIQLWDTSTGVEWSSVFPTQTVGCQSINGGIASVDAETPVDELRWLKNGKQLLIAGNVLALWDVAQQQALWCYDGMEVAIHTAVSPDEKLLAVTLDRAFIILDIATGTVLNVNQEHEEAVLGVEWTRAQPWPYQLDTGWADRLVRWLTNDHTRAERFLLLTWSGDGTARLWDMAAARELSEIMRLPSRDNDDPINMAGINQEGSSIFTVTHGGVVRVWPVWLQAPQLATEALALRPVPGE